MPEPSEPTPSTALALFGVMVGPRRGEEIPIVSPVVNIGQGPQNDVVLADDSVSRNHARLEFELGSWMLTDLESTNGTAIEGVKLAAGVPTPLSYASTVRFGGVEVQFREVERADPAAARAAFTPAEPSDVGPPRHFRLPLWVFLLILIILAVAIFFLVGAADAAAVLP
jgi:pSer/pThr/pTyr-binding forkhead associated (FHA) protein